MHQARHPPVKQRVNDCVPAPAFQVNEWRVRAETYEKEKEFYYQKLRDIELLCQTPVIQDIEVGTAQRQPGAACCMLALSADDARRQH